MFLTPDEVQALTGYRRPSMQCKHLERIGVPYFPNRSGKPIVLRSDLEHKSDDVVPTPAPHIATQRPECEALETLLARRGEWRVGGGGGVAGVYFLWGGDELLYVGLSQNVTARLRAHRMQIFDHPARAIPFDSFSVHEAAREHLCDLEAAYIEREHPPFNVVGVTRDAFGAHIDRFKKSRCEL